MAHMTEPPLRFPLRGVLARTAARLGRLSRFAITGTTAGAFQLLLLKLLVGHGMNALAANSSAFVLAAQLNFVLSNAFTWGDRARTMPLWRRWLAFHGSISGMALVNLTVYTVARMEFPYLEAAAAGIAAASIGNFLLGDRLIFRAGDAGLTAAEQVAA